MFSDYHSCCLPAFVAAQDEPAAEEPVTPAPKASKQPPKSLEQQRQEEERAEAFASNAAVQAVRLSNPQTPAELFRAITLMADFGFYPEAKDYVTRFLAAKPTPATCAAIIHEQGTAALLRLDRVARLDAPGRQMVEMILDGAAKHARDPARLEKLAGQVADPSATARQEAIIDLAEAGEHGAAALVAALADPDRQPQHAAIRDALVALETRSLGPLIAALDAADPRVQAQAAQTLGQLVDRAAVLPLLAPALAGGAAKQVRDAASAALRQLIDETPSPRAAQILLSHEADNHLTRRMRLRENAAGQVSIWTWDAGKRRPVAVTRSHDDAQAQIAARLARDLYRIAPDSRDNRLLYLVANLEHAKLTAGIDAPLPLGKGSIAAEAAAMGQKAIDDVLDHALRHNHIAAAIAAAEIMGANAGATLLHCADGRPATLVDAARHADRRVRFAASAAIIKINPTSPYAGSSAVAEAIADLVTAAGRPRAMVATPRADHAQSLAALLSGLGYDASIATTGRDCVLGVSQSADYELLLVDVAIGEPEILWAFDALRRDRRTARLPIGLMADRATWDTAQRLARRDALTLVVSQAQDERTMEGQVRRLVELAGTTAIPPNVRLAQAETALGWMATTANNPHGLYDWKRHESAIRDALGVSRLTAKAAAVLAQLGTHSSQRSLVELAGQNARPLPVRQAAAAAFTRSVPRFGVQLTTDEIAAQYARYNQSRDLDAETQRVLATVLDAIEGTAAVKEQPAN